VPQPSNMNMSYETWVVTVVIDEFVGFAWISHLIIPQPEASMAKTEFSVF
jgi:hypothetical protein